MLSLGGGSGVPCAQGALASSQFEKAAWQTKGRPRERLAVSGFPGEWAALWFFCRQVLHSQRRCASLGKRRRGWQLDRGEFESSRCRWESFISFSARGDAPLNELRGRLHWFPGKSEGAQGTHHPYYYPQD